MEANLEKPTHVEFNGCDVIQKNGKTFYIWKISDETKDKIRKLLNKPDLEFGFNATLEQVPPYSCPECGIEITLFDVVRAGLNAMGDKHGREFMIEHLQKNQLIGNGISHEITCENGHTQPIFMGWAANFGWTYDYPPSA
ncbi:MAG: hypothetical protein ACPGJS_14820 [Flammeovirgaceae bacterium]